MCMCAWILIKWSYQFNLSVLAKMIDSISNIYRRCPINMCYVQFCHFTGEGKNVPILFYFGYN